MKKRILSGLLAVCMLLTLLPVSAFADETEETAPIICTGEEACQAETHEEGCPRSQTAEPESDSALCTQDSACAASVHLENCPQYDAEESTSATNHDRRSSGVTAELLENMDPEDGTRFLSVEGYDYTIRTADAGSQNPIEYIQAQLNETPENGGDVLVQIDTDIELKGLGHKICSIPTDKNINSVTFAAESGKTIALEGYNDRGEIRIYCNGIPIILDTGIHFNSYAIIYGGGDKNVIGSPDITVKEGAAASMIYGGGLESDVTGDVSITVHGEAGTIYGGGYAHANSYDEDKNAEANVFGNIDIEVSGENSSLGSLIGGGRAYINSSKQANQTLRANVTGNIGIKLDCMVRRKIYGGGSASIEISNKNNADNRILEADVKGKIEITVGGNTKAPSGEKLYLNGGGCASSGFNWSDSMEFNTSVTADVTGDISIDASQDFNPTSGRDGHDDSMFSELYGGGWADGMLSHANVDGSIEVVTSRKVTLSNVGVYGGGYAKIAEARVTGDTHVRVCRAQDQPVGHENAKGVIGGGNAGYHGDATVEGNTFVTIDDGVSFEENSVVGITGGGRVSQENAIADVWGNVTLKIGKNVTIPAGAMTVGGGCTYGYKETSACVRGSIDIDVADGFASKSLFIGGGYAPSENSKATVGLRDNPSAKIMVTFHGNLIENMNGSIYSAGYAGGSSADASVFGSVSTVFDNVKYAKTTLWIYVGGYANIGKNAALHVSGDIDVHITNQSDMKSCVVRTAGNGTTIDGNASITVEENSYCDTVYGGGNNVKLKKASINITDASVLNVYGGGYNTSNSVDDVSLTIAHSQITGTIYGGGYQGQTKNLKIYIVDSTIQNMNGAGYKSTAETVDIVIDDSSAGDIYMAGDTVTVTGNSRLTLLGNTTISAVNMKNKDNDIVKGSTDIVIGDGEKETDVKVRNFLYRLKIDSVSIKEKAVLTGQDGRSDGNNLFFNLRKLDIAETGRLVLAKIQDITGDLSGEGTIVLPDGTSLVVRGSFTGNIVLETATPGSAQVGDTLAWSLKNKTEGTFTYGGADYFLVSTVNEPWYQWYLVPANTITATVVPDEDGETHGTVTSDVQSVAPGGTAVLTVTRDPGYKVGKILVAYGENEIDVTSALRDGKLTLSNITQDTAVTVSFEAMTAEDVKDSAEALPEITGEPTDKEKETILDTKLDYEALPDEEKEKVSEEEKEKLNDALSKLPNVDVEVKVEVEIEGVEGEVFTVPEDQKPALLENMSLDEAEELKKGEAEKFKIIVTVKEAKGLEEAAEESIREALGGAVPEQTHDVTVKKVVVKEEKEEEKTVTELARPIQLVFAIPEEIRTPEPGMTRSFLMLRTHKEGEGAYRTEKLYGETDKTNWTHAVESDRFSVYTLAYEDTKTGGGGSGAASYPVTVSDGIKHGKVAVSRNSAPAGSTVTITAQPDSGYKLCKAAVTGGTGRTVELTELGNGKYSFLMPDSAVTVTAAFVPLEEPWLPFADVKRGDWFYEAVEYVYCNGLMLGTAADAFSPGSPTTRGMVVTILYRAEGSPAASGLAFEDVGENEYYAEAVAWASENGIAMGYGGGKFGPEDPITREQLAAVLYRYAGYLGMETEAPENALAEFKDAGKAASYAKPALNWAVSNGLLLGVDYGVLDPQGRASRAQTAAVLMRFRENLKQ